MAGHISRIRIDSALWGSWKAGATSATKAASDVANWSFGLVTLAGAAVGLLVLSGDWRYSSLVYAPALGVIVRAVVTRVLGAHRFGHVAPAMRAFCVPQLVEEISDAKLHELAHHGRVEIGERLIFAMETRRHVELVAQEIPLEVDSLTLDLASPPDGVY